MKSHDISVDQVAAQIAARHWGALTHQEALSAGLSEHQIHRRLRGSRWSSQRQGVYTLAGVPPSRMQTLWVAVAAGGSCVISGPTAAWLWRLPKAEFDGIHVLTDDPDHVRADGVIGHRSKAIVPADRRTVAQIAVTSPARTIIDCSGSPDLRRLIGWWVDHGLRESLLSLDELQHSRARLRPARGRSLRFIDAQLERRGAGYQVGDSQPEIRLADWLESAGLGRPRLGEKVWLPGESHPLKPDGLYLPERVGYEYQSWTFHGAGQAHPFHEDPRRMNKLRTAGYDLYPFTAESTEAEVVETIAVALNRTRRRRGFGQPSVESGTALPEPA